MDLTKLSQGDRIVLGAGILLIIDLLFLPWYHVDVTAFGFHASGSASAVQAPNAAYGAIAVIVAVVIVGQLIAARFTSATLPEPPIPWGRIHLYAGGVVLLLLLLKLVAETSSLGFGAYLGLLLAIGLAYGGYTINQEQSSLA